MLKHILKSTALTTLSEKRLASLRHIYNTDIEISACLNYA